jgi:hypothetical protein
MVRPAAQLTSNLFGSRHVYQTGVALVVGNQIGSGILLVNCLQPVGIVIETSV